MYDSNKLRGRIVEKFGSLSNFANKVGLTPTSVSNKLNGHTDFTRMEIIKWCDLLKIDSSEVEAYFFTQKV